MTRWFFGVCWIISAVGFGKNPEASTPSIPLKSEMEYALWDLMISKTPNATEVIGLLSKVHDTTNLFERLAEIPQFRERMEKGERFRDIYWQERFSDLSAKISNEGEIFDLIVNPYAWLQREAEGLKRELKQNEKRSKKEAAMMALAEELSRFSPQSAFGKEPNDRNRLTAAESRWEETPGNASQKHEFLLAWIKSRVDSAIERNWRSILKNMMQLGANFYLADPFETTSTPIQATNRRKLTETDIDVLNFKMISSKAGGIFVLNPKNSDKDTLFAEDFFYDEEKIDRYGLVRLSLHPKQPTLYPTASLKVPSIRSEENDTKYLSLARAAIAQGRLIDLSSRLLSRKINFRTLDEWIELMASARAALDSDWGSRQTEKHQNYGIFKDWWLRRLMSEYAMVDYINSPVPGERRWELAWYWAGLAERPDFWALRDEIAANLGKLKARELFGSRYPLRGYGSTSPVTLSQSPDKATKDDFKRAENKSIYRLKSLATGVPHYLDLPEARISADELESAADWEFDTGTQLPDYEIFQIAGVQINAHWYVVPRPRGDELVNVKLTSREWPNLELGKDYQVKQGSDGFFYFRFLTEFDEPPVVKFLFSKGIDRETHPDWLDLIEIDKNSIAQLGQEAISLGLRPCGSALQKLSQDSAPLTKIVETLKSEGRYYLPASNRSLEFPINRATAPMEFISRNIYEERLCGPCQIHGDFIRHGLGILSPVGVSFTVESVTTFVVPDTGVITAAQLHDQTRLRFSDKRTAIIDTTPRREYKQSKPHDKFLSREDREHFRFLDLANQIRDALEAFRMELRRHRFFFGKDLTSREHRLYAIAAIIEQLLRGTSSEAEAWKMATASSVLHRWTGQEDRTFIQWAWQKVLSPLYPTSADNGVLKMNTHNSSYAVLHLRLDTLAETLRRAVSPEYEKPVDACQLALLPTAESQR